VSCGVASPFRLPTMILLLGWPHFLFSASMTFLCSVPSVPWRSFPVGVSQPPLPGLHISPLVRTLSAITYRGLPCIQEQSDAPDEYCSTAASSIRTTDSRRQPRLAKSLFVPLASHLTTRVIQCQTVISFLESVGFSGVHVHVVAESRPGL
jgi:hypothetical protein